MKRLAKKSLVLFAIIIMTLMLVSCGNSAKAMPKLIDLGADKCIPCKEMAPILDELKEAYAGVLDIEFIDVWKAENQSEAAKYGIKSIPTQIFFDAKGNELYRHVGFFSREAILAKWKELGYDLKPLKTNVVLDDCADCEGCNDVDPLEGGCTCK